MIFINDFKYALRLLSKRPGFTLLTTLVMATGIGLSVYLFSFINTMVFKDLNFENGDSLVILSASLDNSRVDEAINPHDFQEIRKSIRGISEIGSFRNSNVNVSGQGSARRYSATMAEPNIFQLTRTAPVLGRGFTDAENKVGADPVVVIGYEIWQNQYGGNAEIVGEDLRINGMAHRIVGVMPQGYYFPGIAEMWMPMRQNASQLERGHGQSIHGLAHLDPGYSIQDIDQQLQVIMKRLEQRFPKTNSGVGTYLATLPMTMVADGISIIYSMQTVAVFILILASINVGNLLLSRAVERGKETAIRVALGAPRYRIISQMLWESIIICSVGGIIGLLVMAWGLEITESITASFNYNRSLFWFKFGIDRFTLTLFIAFVVGAIVVTGVLPAWKNSGADFNSVLRDGTRGALSKKAGRLNHLLVISEIFVSMTVLIGAGVILLSAYMKTHQDIGAITDNTLTAAVQLTEINYDSPDKQIQFAKTLQSRLENSTGVGEVMISTSLPGSPSQRPTLAIEGREYNEDLAYPRANYISVSAGSLAKLGVELKSGRYFGTLDEDLEKRTALVSQEFASLHFPARSAVGARFRMVELDGTEPQWITIVGIVENTLQGEEVSPNIFRPFSQTPKRQMTVALKMKAGRSVAVRALRKTLQSIDPELPAFRIETYAAKRKRAAGPLSFISKVFSLFGLAAIVLAASGIYGVMSNTVNQRTQEIGVKRALGANDKRITREFQIKGGKHLFWGGIPGLLAGCAMGFAMAQVFGLGTAALAVIACAMATIIGSVVMLATYIPTRRVLNMEPAEALHYE